jgi:isocitrate dehydrogenase
MMSQKFFAQAALLRTLKPVMSTTALRMMSTRKIMYTHTDEAPMLATYSFLPILSRFTDPAGIAVEKIDISVAGRIINQFPERLNPDQRVADNLGKLGELVKTPDANVIKLPNVSASVPQLVAAIKELQGKGYNLPNYVQDPKTAEEKDHTARYSKVLGSAVNPVLREGNSDRRVALPVKQYAQKNPHKLMPWPAVSKTRVARMSGGDFFASEQSAVMEKADKVTITFTSAADGKATVLKKDLALLDGEVIDASFMSAAALRDFFEAEFTRCKSDGVMASLHLKATMMKISDPIMFGHAVTVYFKDLFAKHGETFKKLNINPKNGFNDVVEKIKSLPAAECAAIEVDIQACYAARPKLAMVDSRKGITNLHVPSDVIIDASMPNVVRDAGGMWNADDDLEDVVCCIPDRCYAGIYDSIIMDVQKNGQFNVSTMGSTANVGLMAQKAEEYGSHDKTFEMPSAGTMTVTGSAGNTIFSHSVQANDIWRMCQTKDAPIEDWVKLAVTRARATGDATTFWLDANRPHDANIIAKVNKYLKNHDTTGLDLSIAAPADAMTATCARARAGKNSVTVTGNVLRDYLTDLFPILELGTSAKMLSIVPMMAGGCMYETGAGGSAPKHVQQFEKEGHLRWDSLGEYLALSISLEDLGNKDNNKRATLLGQTLSEAVAALLNNHKSPSRKVKEIDNRGSAFYIAMYWARAMAKHDPAFVSLAKNLTDNEEKIMQELIECQGTPQDIGGYFRPDDAKAFAAMRPSALLNKFIDARE